MAEEHLLDEDSSSGIFLLKPASDQAGNSLRECRVLVIEDSAVQYELVARNLREAKGVDFRPTRADRLSEGLERLGNEKFDIVLLDLNLPDSRGLDTLRKLRFSRPNVPIVVLTGIDDEAVAIQAASEGAQDYLVKGEFGSNVLFRSIRYAIARHRSKAKLASTLAAAKASEANLRDVITNNVDGMIVVDAKGTTQFANPSAEALFGRSVDELRQTPFGFPVTASQSSEVEIVRRDGRRVPVEIRVVPMSWERQPAYLAMLRDLTLQKQAEQEREQLAAIARSTEDAIVSADLDGNVLSWNPGAEKMFGYSAAEVVGRRVSMLAPPEERREAVAIIERAKLGETVSQVGTTRVHNDGRKVDVSLSAFPIRNPRGEVVSIGGVVRDITERRRAQRAQEKLKERQVQLKIAQTIQQRFLPEAPPSLPGFDIAGALYPAELAAGDYFDYLPLADGSTAFAIGDVSGHGFGPALLMAATCAHLHSLVQVRDDIGEILEHLNRALATRTTPEHYVTFLLARLDCETRSLVYANAGHPAGYVLDVTGDVKTLLASTAHPLAIDSDAKFPIGGPASLEAGDTVVLLTDGFFEARPPGGDFFGRERVLEVVRANCSKPAKEIIESLHNAVQQHTGQEASSDDLTAVVIKLDL